ncbi:uncharacterized protein LOC108963496 isoform X2 [Serinus canaria]|uniref:uncharacterized protein LOC108963496 isoform X2 n=1 Tax=Serinus canaria TaxID=9135 RepID=UPI0021CC58D9|nr:uncharacterized protein LOC108963496 isoform X2 [Serinus canaria]
MILYQLRFKAWSCHIAWHLPTCLGTNTKKNGASWGCFPLPALSLGVFSFPLPALPLGVFSFPLPALSLGVFSFPLPALYLGVFSFSLPALSLGVFPFLFQLHHCFFFPFLFQFHHWVFFSFLFLLYNWGCFPFLFVLYNWGCSPFLFLLYNWGCFPFLFQLYHCLRRKWSRRNRGYSRDISLSHSGFCSGAFTNHHGRASFSCGGDTSVTYSRRPSACPPPPAPAPYSISGRFSCDADGSLVVSSGDGGVTSGWDPIVGTVPVYGSGVGMGYGGEDVGSVMGSAGGGGGSVYHGGDSGAGAGYGYSAPLSDTLSTGGVSEGSGYYGGGYGYGTYGTGMLPGPELSPAGGGCAQVVQQKCPVVVPTIKSQQCKQSTHWPPIQKK